MRVFVTSVLLCTAVFVVFCSSCSTEKKQQMPPAITLKPQPEQPKPAATVPTEPKQEKPKVSAEPLGESQVVGEIGDYTITRGELRSALIKALRGDPDKQKRVDPVDAETVLRKMLGERAMMMDGRARDLLAPNTSVQDRNERDLVTALVMQEVGPKIKITASEIDAKIKSNPKMNRTRAERIIQAEKGRKLADKYYEELKVKRHFEKLKDNYPKAIKIHQRLLVSPRTKRSGYWIQGRQIQEELSEEEKNIPLARFDGGTITVEDWLHTVHLMPPNKRPRDLNTVQGVDHLLDKTAPMRLWVAEAKRLGLDKDPTYVAKARKRQDRFLLSEVKRETILSVEAPTDAEVKEYFDKHKDDFRKKDTLRIDQIWCEDLDTANNVRAKLDAGLEFAAAQKQYSLKKRDRPVMATVETDGVFLTELWAAEPNDIVGPIKGFYAVREGRDVHWEIKWRVVKIIKKQPGAMRNFDKSVAHDVKNTIKQQRREDRLAAQRKELLQKYKYTIYQDRIKGIDLFEIP